MSPAEHLAAKAGRRPRPAKVTRRHCHPGCVVRAARISLGLTMKQVASALKINVSTLHYVECGYDLKLSAAQKLADFYGKTVTELWPGGKKK